MDRSNGVNTIMYQDFATTFGASYQLGFIWEGWYSNNNVKLNVALIDQTTSVSLFNGLYTSDSLLSPHIVSSSFTGTGNTIRLLVQEMPPSGTNDNLFLVDNFSVVQTPSVPEPSGLVLLGTGVFAFLTYRTRRMLMTRSK